MRLTYTGKGHDLMQPYPGSAGFDIAAYLPETTDGLTLQPGMRFAVPTGLFVQIVDVPEGEEYYIRVAPRSGLAYKQGLNVLAGVIDRDYTGEVRIILINHGDKPVKINDGDRIAQLIIERIYVCPVERVSALSDPNTVRGSKGFGSSDGVPLMEFLGNMPPMPAMIVANGPGAQATGMKINFVSLKKEETKIN